MRKKIPLLTITQNTIKKHPFIVTFLSISLIGAIYFALLPPLILEYIANTLASKNSIGLSIAVLYFVLIALSGLFDALKEMFITLFGQKITHEVRHEMSEKLVRLPVSYFTNTEPGVTVSRFVNDVDTIQLLFEAGIVGMFVDTCKVISILVLIFLKSKGLGVILLIVTPLLFLFTRYIQKRMLAVQLKNLEAIGKLNNHVPETIKNIRSIHVLQLEHYMENKYDERIEESYHAMDKTNFYDSIYSPVIIVISTLIIAIMMMLSASGREFQTFFGMSVGTAVAIIAYVGKIFTPLESIGMEIQSIQSAFAGVKRISEFLNEEERIIPKQEVQLNTSDTAIQFTNVTFSYDANKTILNELSFSIKQGESVTLIGRTGAGKSTIFKLLLGFYPPQTGMVYIFNQEATSIPDNKKRHLFGYVEQSFRAVPGTIFDQIAVFDPSIQIEDVEKAAKLVGIHERITQFPQGYTTTYEESLFSQGQRQLLSIARSIAANPAILLLDEITANLDTETENKVLKALKNACEKRTVLSISHRLYENTGGRIIEI